MCDRCQWESQPLGKLLPQSPLVVEDIREHTREHNDPNGLATGWGAVTMSQLGCFTGRKMMVVPVSDTELHIDACRRG